MPYSRLLYHLIWATYRREPLLVQEREPIVHRSLGGKASELGVFVHEIGNVMDHIHLVVGIPPTISVSQCIGELKGASSHATNDGLQPFRWQMGYGAVTICDEILAAVCAYVRNQKQHHADRSIDSRFENDSSADFPAL